MIAAFLAERAARREDVLSHRLAARDQTLALASDWIAGELSDADAAKARERYDRDPGFRALVDPLSVAWTLPGRVREEPVHPEQLQEAWQHVRQEAGLMRTRGGNGFELHDRIWMDQVRERRRARAAFRAAWTSAFVLIVSLPMIDLEYNLDLLHVFDRTHRTRASETLTVSLPDETKVTLAPGSRLHYNERSFRIGKSRDVELEGEATFYVTPQSEKVKPRFLVVTPSAMVAAVGTVFTVHAYPGEPTTDVQVIEGRVCITPDDRGAKQCIGAGERVRANSVAPK